MSRRNRRAKGAAIAIMVLVVALIAMYFFAPLSLAEKTARVRLWRHGVKSLDLRGLRAYRRVIGHGEPRCVALIHGAADSALTFEKLLTSDEKDWEHPVALYALDLPGSGHSPPPVDKKEYAVREQAKAVRRALEPTCTHWLVVGNSLGGWVAEWLAHDWPSGVAGLVLTDAVGLKADTEATKPIFDNLDEKKLKTFQKLAFARPHDLPEHIWRAATKAIQEGSLADVLHAQDGSQFLDGQFRGWKIPTLVFWGEADRLVPVGAGKRLQQQIPGAKWQEAPACGHMPQKECVREFQRAIDGMVGRAGAG